MRWSFKQNVLSLFQKHKNGESAAVSPKLMCLIGFKPKNAALFREALTPRSVQTKNDQGVFINYERLEFLGDAVLGAVIAEYLYTQAPDKNEGYLTKMRSKIVSRKHLNQIGKEIGLLGLIPPKRKQHVTLGNNVAGDMFESLIGAIYEDRGFDFTKKFIYKTVICPYVNLPELENRVASYKSLMLEWSQKNKKQLLFETFEEDNANSQTAFVSKVHIDEKEVAKGRGLSKKKAEEKAAKRAFFSFQKEINKK